MSHEKQPPRRETAASSPRWSELEQPRVPGFATHEWNIETGAAWFSPEWERITRSDDYDPLRPNNQDWWAKRVHPHDLTVIQRTCLAMLAGFVDTAEVTYRLQWPDGTWRWLLARSTVTAWKEDGAPRIASGICVDMTEVYGDGPGPRKTSSVSDFDYHSILENSPDLFVRLNRELSPLYVNPAVARYLGRADTDQAFADSEKNIRIAGDYRQRLQEGVERVFAERAVVRESLSLTMSDGSEIFGECSLWPEFDADGNVRHAMLQFRDQTEQRRMEQRAMLNEQRLEALYRLTCMEDAPESEVLDFVMDSVLKLTKSRSGFFFIPEDETVDRGYLLWSEDHYAFLDERCLPNDHMPQDLTIQLTAKNGIKSYRSINNGDGTNPLFVVFDGKMAVMRGIIAPGLEENRVVCVAGVCNKDTDYEESDLQQLETFINSAWLILRRRRFVHELRQAKEAAEAANKAKDAFLANVSHELRTPLNGVLSMLQLIDDMPIGRRQREYLQIAQASGKSLLRIISDLLDFSCMESGKMSLTVEGFDCRATVASALELFADEAAQKKLRFRYTIDPRIPAWLLGDEARVRQIIFNLVGNALKFTAEGGVTVSCLLLPESPPGKAGIVLTFEDTGIGIAPEKLSSIFDAFVQMENRHRRKYSGTGLGLGIVKHLVGMMDGGISVQSVPESGTTVHCTLFFALPGGERATPPVSLPASEKARPLDILVAEDDAVGSLAMRAFLRRGGHRVVCVEDGRQALEALQLHPFHALFTDIEMPNMDGLELVRRVRSGDVDAHPPSEAVLDKVREVFPGSAQTPFNPGITTVAVSAHTMLGDRERFLKQGIHYYISKPIIREELEGALAFVARRLSLE